LLDSLLQETFSDWGCPLLTLSTAESITGKMITKKEGRRAAQEMVIRAKEDSPQTLLANPSKANITRSQRSNNNQTILRHISQDTWRWTVFTVVTLASWRWMLWMLQTILLCSVGARTLTVRFVIRCCPFRWVAIEIHDSDERGGGGLKIWWMNKMAYLGKGQKF